MSAFVVALVALSVPYALLLARAERPAPSTSAAELDALGRGLREF
jgi:hypothetical protein